MKTRDFIVLLTVFPPQTLNPAAGSDLALLSLSQHLILTYGTFGLWGALLSDADPSSRLVLIPSGYEAMKEVQEMDRANLNWVKV